jgi:hypothetical protein
MTQELHSHLRVYFEFYRVWFDARATNSCNAVMPRVKSGKAAIAFSVECKITSPSRAAARNHPTDAEDFEEAALRACELVRAGDPRIGKAPGQQARSAVKKAAKVSKRAQTKRAGKARARS